MIKQVQSLPKKVHSFWEQYQKSDVLAFYSPAIWVFGSIYAAAVTYLIVAGHFYLLLIALYALLTLGVTFLIVIPLTARSPLPAWQEPLTYPRWKLWCQLGVLCLYLFWVFFLSYYFFAPYIPYMSLLEERALLLLIQVIIPVAGVLLLGARWREIGLGRGFNSLRVAGALIAIPLVLLIIGAITGLLQTALDLLDVSNLLGLWYVRLSFLYLLLSAGLPEEIAFRGILMTRLTRIFGAQWGLVLSSLLFGFIHILVNQRYFEVALLDSLALCIVFNAVVGIAFAIVAQRTSNLLAGIIFHTFFDALSFALLPLFLSTFS